MHRKQMIEALVIDNLVNALDRERLFRLHGLHECESRVFARMTNAELRAEIAHRGLGPNGNGFTAEEVEHWHGNDDDDDALCRALSGLDRDNRDAYSFD